MGGLVMRSFLAAKPHDYSRLVRKWVAIASPFGGAPGFCMDALMTGVQFCQVRPALQQAQMLSTAMHMLLSCRRLCQLGTPQRCAVTAVARSSRLQATCCTCNLCVASCIHRKSTHS